MVMFQYCVMNITCVTYLPEGNVTICVGVSGKIPSIRSKSHSGYGPFMAMDRLNKNEMMTLASSYLLNHDTTMYAYKHYPYNMRPSKCNSLNGRSKHSVNRKAYCMQ